MVATPELITVRPLQRPQYTWADDFGVWFRLNHSACLDWWRRCEQELDADPERPGASDEFRDFAECQYDLHRAAVERENGADEADEDAPRIFRTRDEAAAYEAGVLARGEI